mgnify:CR=1 FL=1
MSASAAAAGQRLRLAFLGSPDFAVPTLRALSAAGHEIAAVYCQPPRPAGRGKHETRCPVHRVAEEEFGLPVRTPARLRKGAEEEHAFFAALGLDAAVVVAYGLILPPAMLDAPRRGCLNVHASLLPRWRGAAPIHAAILAGDTETGITVMRMDEGLDTGPVLLARPVPIGPRATNPELHDALAALGAGMAAPPLLRAAVKVMGNTVDARGGDAVTQREVHMVVEGQEHGGLGELQVVDRAAVHAGPGPRPADRGVGGPHGPARVDQVQHGDSWWDRRGGGVRISGSSRTAGPRPRSP